MTPPTWLLKLGADRAADTCEFYMKQCLASATQYRCAGYPWQEWYEAAKRWKALRDWFVAESFGR